MLLSFSVFIIKNLIDEVEYLDKKAAQGLGNEGCISNDSDIANCNTFRHTYKRSLFCLSRLHLFNQNIHEKALQFKINVFYFNIF